MVSEELRKKWGTIFMGDREASLEQLDAMQEPVLRERLRKEQEQDYMERVKQRAMERAKIILGEAYAERQKILEEARKEANTIQSKLLEQARQVQAQAQDELEQATQERMQVAQELAKARETRQEADDIREQAHEEGLQAGMRQANEELQVFRGEMGQGFAGILQLVDGQIANITASWREELVALMQTAVSSATGWILDARHEAILRALVFEAISLLEQREIITVRVNPQDEALVSDLFKAAREKAPEIRQWVVNADESIECGGLVAESGSGSVDCRREHFNGLVNDILKHLSLPEGEADIAKAMELHQAITDTAQQFVPQTPIVPESNEVTSEAEQVTEMVPPAADLQEAEDEGAMGEEEIIAPLPEEIVPVTEQESAVGAAPGEVPGIPSSEDAFSPFENDGVEMAENDSLPELEMDTLSDVSADSLQTVGEESQAEVNIEENVPEAWLPPLGGEGDENVGNFPGNGEGENPGEAELSLSELEDELFPLDTTPESKVLAQGGFLTGDAEQGG